jgi:Protein of unknown function (DUF723)
MPKRLTIEEFIYKANEKHNHKYDYSLVQYVNNSTKVKILCPLHGIFEQIPNSHLLGKGCAKCSNNVKLTSDEFIEKSITIHGNFYDYSFVRYVNSNTKIVILCPLHGLFEQLPTHHLSGHKCRSCSDDLKKQNLLTFIEKSNIVHKNKYDYSNAIYINSYTPISIKCPVHGEFEQTPYAHLNAQQGCPKCAPNSNKGIERFIEEANIIHDHKYDYSKSVYKNGTTKIIIVCARHGEFEQRPNCHLKGQGCPRCGSSSISSMEIEWLNALNIPQEYRQKTVDINNKKIRADAYDPINNIIYEFYGDYWHGNPDKFDPDEINEINNCTFSFLYEATIHREEIIKKAGYKLITIWENDFKKTKKYKVEAV